MTRRMSNRTIIKEPHLFFVPFAFVCGFFYILLTPPFQVPDEENHFYRAWQISTGQLSAVQIDNRVGGYVPANLVEFASAFKPLPLNPHQKITPEELCKASKIPLDPNHEVFVDFPNTSYYLPVSYLPQALAIFIFGWLGFSPFFLLYLARLASLLFWIFLMYHAIRIIPVQKWLLVLLALLPMSVSVNSSLSADVFTNGVAFLFIAVIMREILSKEPFIRKRMVVLTVLIVLLGLGKMVYVVLLFLFLAIPRKRFSSQRQYFLNFSILLLAGLISSFILKIYLDHLYLPWHLYNKVYAANATLGFQSDMNEQLQYVSDHFWKTIVLFIGSFFRQIPEISSGYIGILGRYDTRLPAGLVIFSFIAIFLVAVFSSKKEYKLNLWHRLILVAVFFMITSLIMISQYLTWEPVGSDHLQPLQGRYFIPAFPLVLIALYNQKIRISQQFIGMFSILTLLFWMLFSIVTLKDRYFVQHNLEKLWEIHRNPGDGKSLEPIFITSGKDTILASPAIDSSFVKHTGDSSVLELDKNNPFGFLNKIYHARKGDKIEVSLWTNGTGCNIVFSEFREGGFYYTISRYYDEKPGHWRKLKASVFVPHDMAGNELRVYVWNHEGDPEYLDDFRIRYYSRKQYTMK